MNRQDLFSVVDRFPSQRVVVVGDVCLDHYIRGRVERLNPEAPVPILHAREESEATGGAGNTAKNTARLGAQTTLVSVVGDDETAPAVEAAAGREGYSVRLVHDASRPTIRKVRHLVGSQQLLRVDYEETHDLPATIEERLLALLRVTITPETGAVIVSDYAKGVITARVAETILAAGKRHRVTVAVDAKPSRAAFFQGATLISPNLKEAHECLGLNPLERGGRSAEELAPLLSQKMATDVFLTMGSGGMYVYTKDGVGIHVPQEHVVEVFDVSGAGDTAIAALTLARCCGATPEQAAVIGNAAGAVVVGKIGSAAVSPTELQSMLTHRHA